MSRKLTLFVLMAALALVVVACGGEQPSSTRIETTPSGVQRPSNAIDISIVYAPESEQYMPQVIEDFNRAMAQGNNLQLFPILFRDMAFDALPNGLKYMLAAINVIPFHDATNDDYHVDDADHTTTRRNFGNGRSTVDVFDARCSLERKRLQSGMRA